MKKIYAFLFTLLLASGAAAQNPTAYFMEGSTLRSQFNPAFAPLRGYVNIPGLGGLDINVSGNLSIDKILYPRNGKLVTLLDSSVSTADALSGLKADNLLGLDTRVNLIGFGAFTRNHKNFWSFDLNARVTTDATLPYSLFDFLKRGNSGDISDIGITADSYLEAGFNYSFPLLDDKLYIGVRAKFLMGVARARMYFTQFNVSHNEERWLINAAGGLDITAAGLDVKTELNDHGEEVYKMDDISLKLRLRGRLRSHVRHPAQPAGIAGGERPGLHRLEQEQERNGLFGEGAILHGRDGHRGRHRVARLRHRRTGVPQGRGQERIAHAARLDQRRPRIRGMAP